MSDDIEYEIHEAANLFPMEEETLQELADDIKKNGQFVAVELYCGKIIDGRRRYAACKIAGIKPKTKVVSPADPVAYVLSLNLHRRQLTPSQRAMIGERAREMYDRQAKERQVRKPSDSVVETLPPQTHDNGKARDQAGNAVGVSGKLIDNARTVRAKGVPELSKAVEEGRMSVSAAAKLTEEPAEVQSQVAQEATFSAGRYRKQKPPAETAPQKPEGELQGKGVILANEAINCLIRIPKNDPLRSRGLQIVSDWIKRNGGR